MIANVHLPYFKSESTPRTPLYEDDNDNRNLDVNISDINMLADLPNEMNEMNKINENTSVLTYH